MVAKKDFYAVWTYKSPEGDKDISLPNLEVINLLKSLKSSGYVKETFNWCVRRVPTPQPAGSQSIRSIDLFIDLLTSNLTGHRLPPHHPQSNRQYYYYYLTPEGIAYLREYLNLPADVVPQTHTKRETRPARPAGFGGTCVCRVVAGCFFWVGGSKPSFRFHPTRRRARRARRPFVREGEAHGPRRQLPAHLRKSINYMPGLVNRWCAFITWFIPSCFLHLRSNRAVAASGAAATGTRTGAKGAVAVWAEKGA